MLARSGEIPVHIGTPAFRSINPFQGVLCSLLKIADLLKCVSCLPQQPERFASDVNLKIKALLDFTRILILIRKTVKVLMS